MSNQLIENILDKNFTIAENQFRDRLNAIMEQKLYEKKRMIAAQMDEAMGGLSKAEIDDRRKRGFLKAADVLGDPWENRKLPFLGKKTDGNDTTTTEKKKVKKLKRKSSKTLLKAHMKRLKESLSVQPDPEGRVTGGKSKPAKANPIMRKIAAKAIKAGRKVGGAEFRKSYLSTKKDIEAQQSHTTKDLEPTTNRKAPPTPKDTDEKPLKPWAQRNKNTFMGREPDEDAKPSRGGRAGKIARKAIGVVASDLLGSVPE